MRAGEGAWGRGGHACMSVCVCVGREGGVCAGRQGGVVGGKRGLPDGRTQCGCTCFRCERGTSTKRNCSCTLGNFNRSTRQPFHTQPWQGLARRPRVHDRAQGL